MTLDDLVWDEYGVGNGAVAMVGKYAVNRWVEDGVEYVCVHVPNASDFILRPGACDWVDVACWLSTIGGADASE